MKKLLSAILAAVMLFSLVTVGTATAWADAPTEDGKVFAGYYTDDTYTVPSSTATEYPKFVDENVLTAKYQLTASANEEMASMKIRVVTTVDSRNYQAIGFHVWVDGVQKDVNGNEFRTTRVATTIKGTDGLGVFTYTPEVFSDDSVYFCAYNFTISSAKYGATLTFQPYWITRDGTEVTGHSGAGGDGKRDIVISQSESFNNILIGTASELYDFAAASQNDDFAGWTVKLTANIDLNEGCTASATGMSGTPTAWTPIGPEGNPFAGTFDGQGHTISGVYLNATARRKGLFGETTNAAVVKNFKLTNSYLKITGAIQLGAIVGYGAGTLQNIYTDAIVESNSNYVGGMVGYTKNTTITIEKCWFAGAVTCTGSSKNNYGGIVGYATGPVNISDCLFTGTVSNSTQDTVGGIVGVADKATLTITDSLSAGTVIGGTSSGLMVGKNQNSSTLYLKTSYVLGDQSTDNVVGVNSSSNVKADYYSSGGSYYENANKNSDYQHPIALIVDESQNEQCHGDAAATTLKGFDFTDTWMTVADSLPELRCFNKFASDTIELSTAAELLEFGVLSQTDNFAGKTVVLGADIDLNPGWDAATETAPANEWTSIGKKGNAFAGTFNGQGHTISGVYLNATAQRQGLFGETAGTAVVKNFKLTNSYLTTNQPIFGAVVGYGGGTLQNVYTDAIVKSSTHYVGMVGYSAGLTVKECWFAGTATCTAATKDYYGGIVGYATGTLEISDCLFTGTVDNNTRNTTGGILGYMAGSTVTITDTLSAGTVVGGSNSGLLVGCNYGTELYIDSSYVLGNEGTANVIGWTKDNSCKNRIHYYYDNEWRDEYRPYSQAKWQQIPAFIVDDSKASEQYRGDAAETTLAGFDFYGTWKTVAGLYPVPTRFVSIAAGIYVSPWVAQGTAEDPYVLKTAAELAEFSARSQTDDFAGKTVKLGADIDLNEGWTASAAAPDNAWTPIGTDARPFAGTFDGDGHTVKGLYFSGSEQYKGMFAAVAAAGAVQNVTLANSYFASTSKTVGAVAGRCAGSLSAVHCAADVSVSGAGNAGGLIGEASGADMLLNGCSFAGSVVSTSTSTGNPQPNAGGLIGLYNVTANDMTLTVQNCLVTGTVSAPSYAGTSPCIGGFIGRIYGKTPVVLIDSCLSAGVVTPNEAATGRYGPIIGWNDTATGAVEIARTYVTNEVCAQYNDLSKAYRVTCTNVRADYNAVTEAAVKADAETAMPLLDWSAWQASAGSFPVPVAAGFGAVSYAASSADLSNLNTLYDGLTLYRGDLHEHADQPYNNWNHVATNEVSYTEYAAQIDELGIDFAASLNHHETAHIDDANWVRAKFVYGTEAGTEIVSGNAGSGGGKIHFDILFKDKADLQYIINKYMSSFDAVTGEYEYTTAFTRAGFTQMIDEVMSMGGFFNIPHPGANDYSDNGMDYWFADGIGIHVITHSYWDAASNGAQRDLWISLLNAGKKVYATAGTDEHNALTGTSSNSTPFGLRALTSVYAGSSAATDKGNLIPYLRQGVFTAGDADIQMCVGSGTKMGGTCSFDGKDLVIRIAEKGSNKYRVNVLSNEGLVYSRELKVGSNTEIRLPADSSAMYYRVEIIDTTMTHPGVVVAYGNPIWNG